jgi:hypothetical protein
MTYLWATTITSFSMKYVSMPPYVSCSDLYIPLPMSFLHHPFFRAMDETLHFGTISVMSPVTLYILLSQVAGLVCHPQL